LKGENGTPTSATFTSQPNSAITTSSQFTGISEDTQNTAESGTNGRSREMTPRSPITISEPDSLDPAPAPGTPIISITPPAESPETVPIPLEMEILSTHEHEDVENSVAGEAKTGDSPVRASTIDEAIKNFHVAVENVEMKHEEVVEEHQPGKAVTPVLVEEEEEEVGMVEVKDDPEKVEVEADVLAGTGDGKHQTEVTNESVQVMPDEGLEERGTGQEVQSTPSAQVKAQQEEESPGKASDISAGEGTLDEIDLN
jgi:hypothetical protein